MPALTAITRAGMKTRGRPTLRTFWEAASAVFVEGDLVVMDALGYVNLAINGGSTYQLNNAGKILGLAQAAAHNGAANTYEVQVACFNDNFEIGVPVCGSNTNGAVANSTVRTHLNGVLVGVLNDNTYGWMASMTNTTNGAFLITEIDKGEPLGTNFGYVWGHFPVAVNATTTRFDT